MSGNRLLALVVGVFFLGGGLSALLGALGQLPVTGSMADGRPQWLQFTMAGIGIPIGAILLTFVMRAHARDNRLMTLGTAVEGTVVEIGKLPYYVNRQPRWRLAYAFPDGKGRAHTAEITLADRAIAEALRPGAPLTVRHAPGNPADNIITDYRPRRQAG